MQLATRKSLRIREAWSENPEGGPESRLWAADAWRGQEARTARPTENGGCTTLRPVANVPGDLSQHFNDGGVLKAGDRVVIKTTSGAKHQFLVTSVHDGVIYGDQTSVPFSEIASVERRESSSGKTTVLVVAVLALVGLIATGVYASQHLTTGI